MKKRIVWLLALALAAVMCAGAFAESAAVKLAGSAADLLFRTDNVTVKAKAEFSLDGEWFKTAEITWVQDNTRSYREFLLSSPKWDGSVRNNGYRLVTDGDKVYVMEVYHAGEYRTGTLAKRRSLLRSTVETELLTRAVLVLAEQCGDGLLKETSENEYVLELDGDVPALADVTVNLLAQFAARRYFNTDSDTLSTETGLSSIYDYQTLSAGILYCTKEYRLDSARVTLKTGEDGQLEQAEGSLSVTLDTFRNGERKLDVTFSAEVSDRGRSMVRRFNPEDYGVTLAGDAMNVDDLGAESDDLTDWETAQAEGLIRTAWKNAGFEPDPSLPVTVTRTSGMTTVNVSDRFGNVMLTGFFDETGAVRGLQYLQNSWQGDAADLRYDESFPDPEKDREVQQYLMDFLRDTDPDRAAQVPALTMEWWYEADGEMYAQYHEDPLDQVGDGVLIVVRISPEWRIEYFSTKSNG